MADHANTQLKHFNSKFWCPGTKAIDCLILIVTTGYVHLTLILSVLKHMEFLQGKCARTELHSLLACNQFYSHIFALFISGVYYLPRNLDIFIPGPSTICAYEDSDLVFQGCPNFNILALSLSFCRA